MIKSKKNKYYFIFNKSQKIKYYINFDIIFEINNKNDSKPSLNDWIRLWMDCLIQIYHWLWKRFSHSLQNLDEGTVQQMDYNRCISS